MWSVELVLDAGVAVVALCGTHECLVIVKWQLYLGNLRFIVRSSRVLSFNPKWISYLIFAHKPMLSIQHPKLYETLYLFTKYRLIFEITYEVRTVNS